MGARGGRVETEPVETPGRSLAFALQCVTSAAGTVVGQALGQSTAGKLAAGFLLCGIGAFLTAPGRRHGRRVVAVGLLLALLRSGSALARGRWRDGGRGDGGGRRHGGEGPSRPGGSGGSGPPRPVAAGWAPASWTLALAATLIGFALGSGVTAARDGWAVEPQEMDKAAGGEGKAGGSSGGGESKGGGSAGGGGSGGGGSGGGGSGGGSGGSSGGGGETTLAVPSLTGLDRRSALVALREVALPAVPAAEYSDSVPRSLVTRTEPPAGTEVEPGSPVTVYFSLGPEDSTEPPTPVEPGGKGGGEAPSGEATLEEEATID